MITVYKLNIPMRRSEDLRGLFIADDNIVRYMIDKEVEVEFGEVAGKHSYISGSIEDSEITFVTADEMVIDLIEEFDLETGFNPINLFVTGVEDDYTDLTVGEYILHKLNNTKPL